jgi:hypothetical protein
MLSEAIIRGSVRSWIHCNTRYRWVEGKEEAKREAVPVFLSPLPPAELTRSRELTANEAPPNRVDTRPG